MCVSPVVVKPTLVDRDLTRQLVTVTAAEPKAPALTTLVFVLKQVPRTVVTILGPSSISRLPPFPRLYG